MGRPLRKTESRGRASVPRTPLRTRARRRPRATAEGSVRVRAPRRTPLTARAVGAPAPHRARLGRGRDLRHPPPLELALRTRHAHQPDADVHLHARGHRDGELADTRHEPSYQTVQRTSPPTFSRRAVRSTRMPFGVESTLMPSPLRTAGISLTPT